MFPLLPAVPGSHFIQLCPHTDAVQALKEDKINKDISEQLKTEDQTGKMTVLNGFMDLKPKGRKWSYMEDELLGPLRDDHLPPAPVHLQHILDKFSSLHLGGPEPLELIFPVLLEEL